MSDIEIILGDSLAIMQQYPDNYFDLCLTDPPCGINAHNGIGKYGRLKQEGTSYRWDEKAVCFYEEISRVSRNQIIWCGNYFDLPISRGWLIWDKGAGFKDRDFAEAELAWTSFDKNTRIFQYDPLAKRDYHSKVHPTQKPRELFWWCMKQAENPKSVLDPFLGSGTTAVVCKGMDIDCVGIEISPEYCEIARRRVQEEKDKMGLFNRVKPV